MRQLVLASYFRHLASVPRSTNLGCREISTTSTSFPSLCKGATDQHGGGTSTLVPKGKIFAKEPVKVTCERGQSYKWCSCGVSKKQPFCDGRPMCQPVDFKARDTKDYVFCNCKQTNKQPFCDGTHKSL